MGHFAAELHPFRNARDAPLSLHTPFIAAGIAGAIIATANALGRSVTALLAAVATSIFS